MKKIVFASVSAIAMAAFAAPASAAVATGGRIEAVTGYDHVSIDLGAGLDGSTSGVLFGIGAGYDFAVGPKLALGVDIEAADSTTDIEAGTDSVSTGRDLYAGARLTTALSDKASLYFKAGYTNARFKAQTGAVTDAANADGIRGGGGVSLNMGKSAYVAGEYRYSNYEAGLTRHQGVLAVGFRF